ncbi:DNA phosphorothioation-associated protein 4 [Dehalobacterium formicoaceticum]|uniref:DNA phosphorothioation-associated protein 4 n=1 Tax=Dehalobacterium formicoaceticum TaxID=51515 RepID=UPI0031F6F0C9
MAKTALRKSAEYEQYFQDLGNRPDKIFDTMKDVFMFATTLGFRKKKRVPIHKSGGEDISLRFFKDDDENIFNIIALTDTGEMSVLLPDDEYREKKYKIIEEYANGGISIMVDEFCKPIVDEGSFRRFVETFEDASGNQQKSTLEDILARAIESI